MCVYIILYSIATWTYRGTQHNHKILKTYKCLSFVTVIAFFSSNILTSRNESFHQQGTQPYNLPQRLPGWILQPMSKRVWNQYQPLTSQHCYKGCFFYPGKQLTYFVRYLALGFCTLVLPRLPWLKEQFSTRLVQLQRQYIIASERDSLSGNSIENRGYLFV